MRESDVDFSSLGAVALETPIRRVIVRLSARSRAHAVAAYLLADECPPAGYKLASVDIRSYRPRGGRQRRVMLHYEWTEKPEHHELIESWEQWAELLEPVEKIAKGRG